jgi:integrase
VLDDARRGTLHGMVRTGATFADAAAEWLRYIEHDRGRKPSTVAGYNAIVRSQLLPVFGELPIESISTASIEAWIGSVERSASTRIKALVLLHGIFQRAKKVWGLPANPAADVEKPPLNRSGEIEVFSPEEIHALVRAAASEQDPAIFLTAAFTGLRRGELLALHWRDVDFGGSVIRVRASYSEGQLTTPKSGKVRSVPMAPDVAAALAKLGSRPGSWRPRSAWRSRRRPTRRLSRRRDVNSAGTSRGTSWVRGTFCGTSSKSAANGCKTEAGEQCCCASLLTPVGRMGRLVGRFEHSSAWSVVLLWDVLRGRLWCERIGRCRGGRKGPVARRRSVCP